MSTNLTDESKNAIENYLSKMKRVQKEFHELMKEEENKEIKLIEFITHIHKLKINENCHEFISFLHFLSQISQTHHHKPDIIKIVEDLLLFYKNDIKKHLQNGQLFSIFKNDKKILLFLYKSKILVIDQFVLFNLKSDEYSTFFFPEVKNELSEIKIEEISEKINDDFEKMREQGETNPTLFEIFRNDSVNDFINFTNNNSISNSSIFETNPFLIGNQLNYLELATLFGSMKVFRYLLSKNQNLSSSLWHLAIYGQNFEVIKILKEENIEPLIYSYKDLFIESLKCHDNDISNYIHDTFLPNVNLNSPEFIPFYFKYYNFEYIKTEFVDKSNINDLCLFDYPFIVDTLLKHEKKIDVNKKITVNESAGKYEITKRKDEYFRVDTDIHEYNANIIKTPIYNAVSENNTEVAKLLLSNPKVDLNYKYKYKLEIDIKLYFIFYCISLLIGVLPIFHPYMIPSYFYIIPFLLVTFILNKVKFKVCVCCSLDWLYLMSFKSFNLIEFKIKEFTILHLAVENNNYEMCKLLIPIPNIDVNVLKKDYTRIRSKQTALFLAIKNNNSDIVKLLLSKSKIDVNVKNKFYIKRPLQDQIMVQAFLFLAILSDNFLIYLLSITFFYYYFRSFQYDNSTNITISLIMLHIIVFSVFLCFYNIKKILFYTISVYSMIEILASLKCFVFVEMTALYGSVFNLNTKITKLLLSVNNIDVNKPYKARFHLNRFSKYRSAIEEEKTPLYMSCCFRDAETIKILLSNNKINENIGCKKSKYDLSLNHASTPFLIVSIMTLINKINCQKKKSTPLTKILKIKKKYSDTNDNDEEEEMCEKHIDMNNDIKLEIIKNIVPIIKGRNNGYFVIESAINRLKLTYNPHFKDINMFFNTVYFEYDYNFDSLSGDVRLGIKKPYVFKSEQDSLNDNA